MKRPVVHVTIRDEASGTILHSETKSAFNSGIRASEAAVRKIALSEHTVYTGERQSRVGDVYTRRWVSKTGRAIIATIEKEASTDLDEARGSSGRRKTDPETAGIEYATAQLESDYFMDWVRDQLAEAADMDPSEVLPLETKQDARVIAKNMLQQLEWDTKRDLKETKEFFAGLHRGLTNPSTVDWLAEELLELKGQMRGGGVREAPKLSEKYGNLRIGTVAKIRHKGNEMWVTITSNRGGWYGGVPTRKEHIEAGVHSVSFGPKDILKIQRQTNETSRRVRDYIAVDRRDRPVGPRHKGYSDAKRDADNAGGTVKFVPSGRTQEARRPKARIEEHDKVQLTDEAKANQPFWKAQGDVLVINNDGTATVFWGVYDNKQYTSTEQLSDLVHVSGPRGGKSRRPKAESRVAEPGELRDVLKGWSVGWDDEISASAAVRDIQPKGGRRRIVVMTQDDHEPRDPSAPVDLGLYELNDDEWVQVHYADFDTPKDAIRALQIDPAWA